MRVWRYSKFWWQLSGVWLLLGSACLVEAGIANTKHNLSTSGTGNPIYRATSEQRMCLMCHAPHSTDPAGPLWNHELSGATYVPYSSSTLNAAPGQPTGASKLCLACHDGTIAVGALLNMPGGDYGGTMLGLDSTMIVGAANLGIDLSDDHPVSFVYNFALTDFSNELVDPTGLSGNVRLDSNEEMQCTSCHDPHVETPPMFLRMAFVDGSGFGSPLCIECHNKDGWAATNQHRDSIAQWNGTPPNPWHITGQDLLLDANSTAKSNGCESCHQPHTAPISERLLKLDGESDLCMVCHNNNVAVTYNMDTPYSYTYNHMSLNTAYPDGSHSPIRENTGAGTRELRETSYVSEVGGPNTLGDNRHAECQDCHNPHWARKGVSPDFDDTDVGYIGQVAAVGGTSMYASPVLQGVWGVEPDSWLGAGAPDEADWGDGSGNWPRSYSETFTEVDEIVYQYQLCLKCHSYYAYGDIPPNDPWNNYTWAGNDDDVFGNFNPVPAWNGSQTDQSMEFNPNNPSYHPVAAVGKNPFTGYESSLAGNLTPDSTMGCVDCHYNSSASFSTIGLAKGSHGSETWPLLGAPYDETTGQTGTFDHLCFNCHRSSIYGDGTCNTAGHTNTGFSDGIENLHCFHGRIEQVPCQACHVAVPHGWKRPHMLIYYDDTSPYNSHAQAPWGADRYQYGIDPLTDFNTLPGAWVKTVCHNPGGSPDVVDCGSLP